MSTAAEVTTATPPGFGGPHVTIKTCGCAKCLASAPFRVYHWFCCICGAPKKGKVGYDYQQRGPYYRKIWVIPGSVAGIGHEVCSEPCRIDYLSRCGVDPTREFEPPGMDRVDGEPDLRRPVGSD